MRSTWVVRQAVPTGARWFSAGSCALAAVILLLVLIDSWADSAPVAQIAALVLLVLVCLAATRLFLRSGAELHARDGGVVLKLHPIWSKFFAATAIKEISTVQVKPLPREWGWIGSPDGPAGRVVGVGNVRDAVRIELTDGRRYSLTLDPDDHDLAEVADRLREYLHRAGPTHHSDHE